MFFFLKQNYATVNDRKLSGNPGYQIGKPVQAFGDSVVKDGYK